MNKLIEKLQKVLMPIANKLNKNTRILALRDGFMLSLPYTMVGSILTSLFSIPLLDDWMDPGMLSAIRDFVSPTNTFSNGILALIVCLGIAYSLSKRHGLIPLHGALTAVIAFLINIPIGVSVAPNGSSEYILNLSDIGSKSIMTAMLFAMVSVEVYRWAVNHKLTIKLPAGVPGSIQDSFTSFLPAGTAMLFAVIIRTIFLQTEWGDITTFIFYFVQSPLKSLGTTYPAMLIYGIFVNLCWFFGIHGQSLTGSVFGPLLKVTSAENLAALDAGQQLPNIVTSTFAKTWISYGAWIAIPLLIAIYFFRKKRKDWAKIGKLGIAPGIFNIYEPLMFGIPLVLNPFMLVPMLLTPVITTTIGYFTTLIGLIPYTTGIELPITIPIGISGILSNNSLLTGLLQLLTLIPLIGLWYLFLKVQYKSDMETGAYIEEDEDAADEFVNETA
ncbi:PTS sugar transporter subunit IIC [Breznakia pachnodae]|uniref:Permease IIC component n=1 Tax=Breznakia pachnodae TaxID=265178 RepID=A0ABU0E4G7_9FIRM|nr:PTS transporter subunit EIIC [Breznakia pachnodae]MDQ0361798.1 PTS system cellobiose-specific IIC component [Breznakia pachnodae]